MEGIYHLICINEELIPPHPVHTSAEFTPEVSESRIRPHRISVPVAEILYGLHPSFIRSA